MIDLRGRAALVTGGSRGIGAACCLWLARAGASVAVNYAVETPAADAVVRAIEDGGGRAFALAADVADRDEAEMMVQEARDRFGRLDILVNNAGIWEGSPVEEISDDEWSRTMDVNLRGAFHTVAAAVPILVEAGRGGAIVNVSSTAGQRGEAGHAAYAASKGGLQAFTKSLAVELAPHGIRVNAVAPGWVETDMTREALAGDSGAAHRAAIPLGRAARPEEVAAAVGFLASDLASFVTGEILNVNGGAVLCG